MTSSGIKFPISSDESYSRNPSEMSLRLEGLEDVATTAIPAKKDLLLIAVRFSHTNYRLISFPEKLSPNFSLSPPECAIVCLFEPVSPC